jgi:hypothetical protein
VFVSKEIQFLAENAIKDSSTYIDCGVDSIVHAVADPERQIKWVAKFYRQNYLTLPQIEHYLKTTNTAANLTNQEDWRGDFGFWMRNYAVRVTPFIELLCIDSAYVGICEAILAKSGNQYKERRGFTSELDRLGEKFNQRLGVNGINFSSVNVKIGKKTVYITDLCDDIMDFSEKNHIH